VEFQWSSGRDVEACRRTLKEVPAERGRTERRPQRAGTGEGRPTAVVGGRPSLLGLAVGVMLDCCSTQRISTSVIHYVEDREGGGDYLLENSRYFAGGQPQGGEMFRPELDVESTSYSNSERDDLNRPTRGHLSQQVSDYLVLGKFVTERRTVSKVKARVVRASYFE
jgi:hypothetical protein